ncbi:hypothetical protein pb186bvf_020881 [Paramecium bursaria]
MGKHQQNKASRQSIKAKKRGGQIQKVWMVEQDDGQIIEKEHPKKKSLKNREPYVDHCFLCVSPSQIDFTGRKLNENFYRCIECKQYICKQHLDIYLNSVQICHPELTRKGFTAQTRCRECKRYFQTTIVRFFTSGHYDCKAVWINSEEK